MVKNEKNVFYKITEKSAYWIGFIMADGCIHKNKLSLNLSVRDKGHLIKLKKYLETNNKISELNTKAWGKNYKLVRLQVSGAGLIEGLKKYGITQNKSITAKVDKSLVYNKDFWRGVIDGDGCISLETIKAKNSKIRNSYCYPYISLYGSINLINQFCAFLKYVINKNYTNSIKIQKNGYADIHFGGKNAFKTIDFLYKDSITFLKRKKKIYLKITKSIENKKMFIGAVRKLDKEKVIDIRKYWEENKEGKTEKVIDFLSRRYNVSKRLIGDVVYNKEWRNEN